MKKVIVLILIFALILSISVSAEEISEKPKIQAQPTSVDLEFDAGSVILMEAKREADIPALLPAAVSPGPQGSLTVRRRAMPGPQTRAALPQTVTGNTPGP